MKIIAFLFVGMIFVCSCTNCVLWNIESGRPPEDLHQNKMRNLLASTDRKVAPGDRIDHRCQRINYPNCK
ncbi:hypothetical protein DAI22_04g034100 [Oryza sativa Japonica Group]|nr:hypothetical protein DAI22_04g034100 [Oryza sativa Japonica Group]